MRKTPVLLAIPVVVVSVLIGALGLTGAFGGSDASDGPERTPPLIVDGPSPGVTLTATPVITGEATAEPTDEATPSPQPRLTDPPSADEFDYTSILQLVDKQHPLPSDYVPPNLVDISGDYMAPGFSASMRSEAAGALSQMLDAAYAEGVDIRVRSGYRSYEEQEATFQYWVSVYGYEEAVRQSAMAGFSEHQTGLAVDVSSIEVGWDVIPEFGATVESEWLMEHAGEYGFALSYPACCEATTGYAWEPWHWRYIGVEGVAAFVTSGLTLNQFLAR